MMVKKEFKRCRCTHKNNKKVNPYIKFSYNSGLITNDNKKVYGLDSDWLLWEIKNGNGLQNLNGY